ncbi:MAG: hypothetical protein J6V66_04880 [Clostridia bacterium]|nr:hypothetical protein [Clostridia bacterium]
MKKAKILALSNFIIIAVVTIVAIIGFAPEKSVTISGTQKYQAIYKGSSNSGGVALMINVYENAEVTKKMVELLQKNNAKATFFIGGSWADDNV